jgi:hypothetical protein
MPEEKAENQPRQGEEPSARRPEPAEAPRRSEPERAEPGLTERIRAKLKKLMDDDPNVYPLF